MFGIIGTLLSVWFTYTTNTGEVVERGMRRAESLLSRAVVTYMVSTHETHELFEQHSADPTKLVQKIRETNEVFLAVSNAVTNDFGADEPRVQLSGDKEVYGYAPLGKRSRIETDFERKSALAFKRGEKSCVETDENSARIALPLWSDTHPGCAECHFTLIEGPQSDMKRHILLGAIISHVPYAAEMEHAKSQAAKSALIYAAVIGMAIAGIWWVLRRFFMRPISLLRDQMLRADLNTRLHEGKKDEIGSLQNAFDGFVESIKKTLLEVSAGSSAVASSSSQISTSTEEIAAGAQEQTSQASTVAAAAQEMSHAVEQNSQHAKQAVETALQATAIAVQGEQIVGETTESIRQIADVVKKSAATVQMLGDFSNQIGRITEVIDEIANQTNLLALNAAIESARAGEQGRGFAVVADEVRKLAERTTKATKDIATMITQIQTETRGAVDLMKVGEKKVDSGLELAVKAASALKEIRLTSESVTDMVTQIANAHDQQAATAEQIARNIKSINTVSEETALGTAQIAQAADNLKNLSETLEQLLARFSLDGIKSHYHANKSATLTRSKKVGAIKRDMRAALEIQVN